MAANEVIIITTPETTAITDAYALVKSAVSINRDVTFRLVINRAENQRKQMLLWIILLMYQISFLMKLQPLGYILYDDSVMKSTKQQNLCHRISKSQAAKQLNDIAYALTSSDIEGSDRP